MNDLWSQIQQKAQELGFDALGITQNFEPEHGDYYQKWLDQGQHGEMGYLAKNQDKRLHPDRLMEETLTMIVLATSYNHNQGQEDDFKVARYAQGQDYHRWIKSRMETLSEFIGQKQPRFRWRSFVDTGPLLERDLATKAGLGWTGKNSCLIDTKLGSYLFLSVILCNLPLPVSQPQTDHCGTCTRCIDACPTQALTPYQLNASQCISYHNIEKRGDRDPDFYQGVQNWLVGCDICQEVCPWNDKAPLTKNQEWLQGFSNYRWGSLTQILQTTSSQYRKRYKDSPLSRIKYIDFMRNTFLVIANLDKKEVLPQLLEWGEKYQGESIPEWQYCVTRLQSG